MEFPPPIVAATVAEDSNLGQPRAGSAREASLRPPTRAPRIGGAGAGGRRCVTPRQTCPRPNGLGRNLRSKTRWFTGFCNSHQVSHFATFFIDARAEISIAESRYRLISKEGGVPPHAHRVRGGGGGALLSLYFPWRNSRRGSLLRLGGESRGRGSTPRRRGGRGAQAGAREPRPRCFVTGSRVVLPGRFRQ